MVGLQSLLHYLVAHPLPHVNFHVQFLNLVAIQPPTAATLEIAHLVQCLWQRNVLVGIWFLEIYLVDQRILDVINSVGRPDGVVYMLVVEYVTLHHVTFHLVVTKVSNLLVVKHVVPLEETAGILVQLHVTLWHHALI